MPFNQGTRNRLQRFVNDARSLLADEFTRQLQQEYGLDPKTGEAADLSKLSHLDDSHLETARVLREILAHYLASEMASSGKKSQKDVLDRIVREQAFTVLNRLAALHMMEARGLLRESIANGYQSQGFQLYERLAGHALGETGDAYRCYLFSLFDEFALDLKVLFDRNAPQGLLFPRESAFLELLDLLNEGDMEALWGEDETIGWLYQYFNSTEERKKMRKESAAPRNSRELAVRNQFFTPRYVVEFLTDNTLGRIWYEMTRGQTHLAEQCRYLVRRPTEIFLAEGEAAPEMPDQEGLSQEELLRQPVHIPHRPLKDPHEIRLLDPACGSMHFGLYAFDLFETIYEEAWDNGSCPTLHEAYPSKDEFLKDVPRLIIEHNIHGIDIDPRAVQIAGLSLWLRAQKAWQAQGIQPAERPQVRRSNIVCAEPMPGSDGMLEDFVATLDPPLLGELVKAVFDKMQLAGEAGSLLKIEEEIRTAIDTARKDWLKQQDDLFTREDGSHGEFFETAEQQVIAALRAYAEQADADSYQRRLFADDAARGFAFIDLCRKRYDAVVMNPPFGDRVLSCNELFENEYGDGKLDLYHYFYERAEGMLSGCGRVGAITPRTLLYQSRYTSLRRKWIDGLISPSALAELDLGVLDTATVRPLLVVLGLPPAQPNTFYKNLKHAVEPSADLLSAVEAIQHGKLDSGSTFHKIARFSEMPGVRISLWAPEPILDSFSEYRTLEPNEGKVTEGLSNEDDLRFLRCWWETPINGSDQWKAFGKFDSRSTFLADFSITIDWSKAGYFALGERGNRRANEKYYFRQGIAFTRSCEVGMAATALPEGLVFAGTSRYFIQEKDRRFGLLAYLNSKFAEGLHLVLTPDRDRISGTLRKVPVCVDGKTLSRIGDIGARVWGKKYLWVTEGDETHRQAGNLLGALSRLEGIQEQSTQASITKSEVESLEDEIESLLALSLPFERDDLKVLAEEVRERSGEKDLVAWNQVMTSPSGAAHRLVSAALGATFGRWDIHYATGERQPPELPDPFDPLPVCPPGMLQNAEGLPTEPKDVPADYPLRISWPGILVNDENHPEDIVARLREAIEVIWPGSAGSGSRAEAIEQEACEILGVTTLRYYFRRPAAFFADHLKRYSKSRRKAPIYWPISTKSGSYTLWLYYHRLNDQTLYICVNDFVEPKLQQVKVNLESLRKKSDRTSKDEKDLSMFFDLKSEFEEYREDLLRVAKFWKPDLNDGVQITAAPLWSLFRHKPWQKLLKETWNKLEKGDYDWAHLAMNYWPDRVREKCRTDKSLAIAHGLEELYEEPAKNGASGR